MIDSLVPTISKRLGLTKRVELKFLDNLAFIMENNTSEKTQISLTKINQNGASRTPLFEFELESVQLVF